MADDSELYDVDGWLMFYAVIRIAIGVLALFYLLIHLFEPFLRASLMLYLPVLSAFIAGYAIVRQKSWAIPAVGIDMMIQLLLFAVNAYQKGTGSLAVLLGEAIEVAILYAWFEYFRTSKRVNRALGRNLLGPPGEVAA